MICLHNDMTAEDAKHEIWLEGIQLKLSALDSWLKEARSDIKAGDVVSLKDTLAGMNLEILRLVEKGVIVP